MNKKSKILEKFQISEDKDLPEDFSITFQIMKEGESVIQPKNFEKEQENEELIFSYLNLLNFKVIPYIHNVKSETVCVCTSNSFSK